MRLKPPSRQAQPQHPHGFTLIELAVALFVLTILITGVLSTLSVQIGQRRNTEAKKQLDEAREALLGFVVTNGRLPRPATSASDGTERPGNCTGRADCTGFLPWTTLGLQATDPWGKLIRYSVEKPFSDNARIQYIGGDLPGCTKAIYERNTAGLNLIAGTASGNNVNPGGAAAVVYSHGARNFGTLVNGTTVANLATGNSDEQANTDGTANGLVQGLGFVSRESATAANEFDDVMVWIPTTLMLGRLIQAGRLPPPPTPPAVGTAAVCL